MKKLIVLLSIATIGCTKYKDTLVITHSDGKKDTCIFKYNALWQTEYIIKNTLLMERTSHHAIYATDVKSFSMIK
jgi:hypothetical protein